MPRRRSGGFNLLRLVAPRVFGLSQLLVLAALVAIGSAIAVSAAGRVYLDLLLDQWNGFVFWLENLFS